MTFNCPKCGWAHIDVWLGYVCKCEPCSACERRAPQADDGKPHPECPVCEGHRHAMPTMCPDCKGTGIEGFDRCDGCAGRGRVQRPRPNGTVAERSVRLAHPVCAFCAGRRVQRHEVEGWLPCEHCEGATLARHQAST